jgi:hypothetical protein
MELASWLPSAALNFQVAARFLKMSVHPLVVLQRFGNCNFYTKRQARVQVSCVGIVMIHKGEVMVQVLMLFTQVFPGSTNGFSRTVVIDIKS